MARLAPGNYTAIISGVNNTTGIGLVEGYALDTNASHAANISTRGRVGAGDEVLIGGFIVGGQTTKANPCPSDWTIVRRERVGRRWRIRRLNCMAAMVSSLR